MRLKDLMALAEKAERDALAVAVEIALTPKTCWCGNDATKEDTSIFNQGVIYFCDDHADLFAKSRITNVALNGKTRRGGT